MKTPLIEIIPDPDQPTPTEEPFVEVYQPCPECGGDGTVDDGEECPECVGTGRMDEEYHYGF